MVQTIEMISHYEENVIHYLYLKRLLVVYRVLKAQSCAGNSYDIINDEIYDFTLNISNICFEMVETESKFQHELSDL